MNRPLIAFFSCAVGLGLVENYEFLHKLEWDYIRSLPNRSLSTLKELKSSLASCLINRLDYSPRTARRAERVGADIELIVAALIYNVDNTLAPENHSQMSATIIRPFSLDEVTWILQMHSLFQMNCYLDKFSLEKDGRDIYSEHKLFNAAVKFCQKLNQLPFVPECQKRNSVILSPQPYNNTAK